MYIQLKIFYKSFLLESNKFANFQIINSAVFQMGKQTMGTPCHTWQLQSETKLYRLQTPATPLFRPVHYDEINLDDFAMGTNAIVAVISYTVSTTEYIC